MAQCAVHPRWRGEQFLGNVRSNARRGSSPLARGTGHDVDGTGHGQRFIPAGAGNSSVRTMGAWAWAVHPRWRGEQQAITGGGQDAAWFIPAGAGNR